MDNLQWLPEITREIITFLSVKDVAQLRLASRYFKATVDGAFDRSLKVMADVFEISVEEYKSDKALEGEIRSFLMNILKRIEDEETEMRLKRKDLPVSKRGKRRTTMFSGCKDTYGLFKRMHARPTAFHLPKLTYYVLKTRKELDVTDAWGIVVKILEKPREHKESLKHLTREIFRIPRDNLVWKLQKVAPFQQSKFVKLQEYQDTSRLKAICYEFIGFAPRVLVVVSALLFVLLQVFGVDSIDCRENLMIVAVAALFASFQFYGIWRERYENFID